MVRTELGMVFQELPDSQIDVYWPSMNEELATQKSEPTPGRWEAFIRVAAKISPAAPLIAIGFSLAAPDTHLRVSKIIIESIGPLIILAGLGLAILALGSVREYGARGIRTLAKAGIVINGVVLGLCILIDGVPIAMEAYWGGSRAVYPGYTRAEMNAMREIIPGSRKIFDETIGFRMEVPGDCQDNPNPPPTASLYSFIQPDAKMGDVVINVARLGSNTSAPLRPQDIEALQKTFPPGAQMQRSTHPWSSNQLDVFTVQFQVAGAPLCAHVALVPLLIEPIQVTVIGPASRESESMHLLYRLLDGLKGKSIWNARGQPLF